VAVAAVLMVSLPVPVAMQVGQVVAVARMALEAVVFVALVTIDSWGLAVHAQVLPEGGKWR